ncbi:type II toxin-antitoxin system PemK/MazF family toxin [Paenibacillus ehimensis]|uniref:type II toxin-antitoxin system PemK/MazF family toxin n=1 Tax=Paenibacillus ehimensis TaxID=79264 RepID=UPI00389958B1
MVAIQPTAGHEQAGKRPALVISPDGCLPKGSFRKAFWLDSILGDAQRIKGTGKAFSALNHLNKLPVSF